MTPQTRDRDRVARRASGVSGQRPAGALRQAFVILACFLVGAIILLGAIGYGLDHWMGTSPWFLIGGLLLGIVVGFNELIKSVRKR